ELSPSRSGLQLFCLGDLPPEGRKEGAFEGYQTARFVTVTGEHLSDTPVTIEERQQQLEKVHTRVFAARPAKAKQEQGAPREPTNLDDRELLRRARECLTNGNRFSKLWAGDSSDYKSRSEADAGLVNFLAFWTGGNYDRVVDLFAQSGLA